VDSHRSQGGDVLALSVSSMVSSGSGGGGVGEGGGEGGRGGSPPRQPLLRPASATADGPP
jgi:hypothetical protein